MRSNRFRMGRKQFKLHARHRIVQDSPFLELPGEIRNIIYGMLLVKPGSVELMPDVCRYSFPLEQRRRDVVLSQCLLL